MGFALAAVAFYTVREVLAAFVLFSLLFVAFGAALLLMISAEEALVWGMRNAETYFGRFRARHFALATGPATHRRHMSSH